MRPRATILVKLLLAVAAPTLALFAGFAVVAYGVTRRDLDAELGTRLTAVAASAATQVRGKYLASLAAGDEAERAHQNVVAKLAAVAAVTGARLYGCTDAGGADEAPERRARFTLDALLELTTLVEAFRHRG